MNARTLLVVMAAAAMTVACNRPDEGKTAPQGAAPSSRTGPMTQESSGTPPSAPGAMGQSPAASDNTQAPPAEPARPMQDERKQPGQS